jgi:threonine dehydrogenase-like Zn-dependent dehydrogenase
MTFRAQWSLAPNCGLSQVICGLEKAGLTSGQRLVIQGAGGLGLYATAVAKEKGATVIVLDAVEERLALARGFGADQALRVGALAETDLVNRIREWTDGEGADVVLEVAGGPQAFPQGVAMSRTGGTYFSIGNVSVDKEFEVPLTPGILTRKSLRVIGLVRYEPVYLLKAVRFLQRTHKHVAYEKLTPTEFGLDAVQEALEKAEARAVIRPVIVPSK